MESAKTKLKLDVSEDRISYLPKTILSHIQSFLPTEDVVKMSFLSRKWRSSWSPLSVLKLDFQHFSEKLRLSDQPKGFVEFVDRTVVLHKGQHLEEVRLSFDISQFEGYILRIDNWVSFLVASDCRTLEIDFWGGKKLSVGHYSFPQCPFPYKSVENLILFHCIFRPLKHISCFSLKIISLSVVQLPDSSVNDLLDSFPCLIHLVLVECAVPAHFKAHSPETKLEKIEILSCKSFEEDIQLIDINIPSLVYFKFEGNMVSQFTLNSPKNLIEAELKFNSGDNPVSEEMSIRLRRLLMELCNVQRLTLSESCLQAYRDELHLINAMKTGEKIAEFYQWFRNFGNLKHLSLHCTVLDVAKLACLLLLSPNLESLSLDLNLVPFEYLYSTIRYDFTLTTRFSPWFPSTCFTHLKIVEINGFEGRRDEMDLVATFLMNMKVLEKMIITEAAMNSRYAKVKQAGDKKQRKLLEAFQQKTIENILTIRRGSPSAKVKLLNEVGCSKEIDDNFFLNGEIDDDDDEEEEDDIN